MKEEIFAELYVDRAENAWKVRIVNDRGDVLLISKGFEEAADCYRLVEQLKAQIADAPVSEIRTL